jgi:SAM-dependent methyltransferase
MSEKIEILPVTLLDRQRSTVSALKYLARLLGLEFGWHYLLDLSWALAQLNPIKDQRIMDAGAGVGILQWYLAGQGAQVLSVDRASRAQLPLRFRLRYHVRGLRASDLQPWREMRFLRSTRGLELKTRIRSLLREIVHTGFPQRLKGQVLIYNQDLKSLVDIPDAALDVVVAISALEHNPPEDLGQVIKELMRVLKPGGLLLATLCAARDHDTFHEPSQGWCYTASTLRDLFKLAPETPDNYACYDQLFTALRDCAELRDHLAGFYAKSGDNGMPWGIWDPQYQPVGVCKVKRVG